MYERDIDMLKRLALRLLSCLVLGALLFSLVSCGNSAARKYPAKKQTAEEAKAVVSLESGDSATYDLYRFAFLSYCQGHAGELAGEELHRAADREAIKEICRVYAMFSTCRDYGIDPFGQTVEERIPEEVAYAIENGDFSQSANYAGYLEALQKGNMTDAVYRLYTRYNICEELLAKELKAQKVFPTSDDDLLAFLNDKEQAARVMWCYINPEMVGNYSKKQINELIDEMTKEDDAGFSKMVGLYQDPYLNMTSAMYSGGVIIGRYDLSSDFEVLTKAAFSLEIGQTSERVNYGYWEEKNVYGFFIVRRVAVGAVSLGDEQTRESLLETYMLNKSGEMLQERADSLLQTATYTDFYRSLILSDIAMP